MVYVKVVTVRSGVKLIHNMRRIELAGKKLKVPLGLLRMQNNGPLGKLRKLKYRLLCAQPAQTMLEKSLVKGFVSYVTRQLIGQLKLKR